MCLSGQGRTPTVRRTRHRGFWVPETRGVNWETTGISPGIPETSAPTPGRVGRERGKKRERCFDEGGGKGDPGD